MDARTSVNILLLCNLLHSVHSYPLKRSSSENRIVPTNRQISFMQQFGYLDEALQGFEAQYSQNTLVDAIKNMQRFGGIKTTGILDEDTLNLMKRKRCGVKDIIRGNSRFKRYTIVSAGWKRAHISYYIKNWNQYLGESTVKSEIRRAFDMWENGILKFMQTNDPLADIKISFDVLDHGDSYPFDGPGGVLGHAFFPYLKHGGSVHFDDDEYWSLETNYTTETTGFFLPAVHELGHALGLGHSDVPTAIMYPYYSEYEPEALDNDDILALRKLYLKNVTSDKVAHIMSSTAKYDQINTTELNKRDSTTEQSPTLAVPSFTNMHFDENKESDMSSKIDEICNGYDSITVFKEYLYVFKGNNVWKFKQRGILEPDYPQPIRNIFKRLPTLKKINAAYENNIGLLIFFIGSSYWIYDNYEAKGPFPLYDYFLPHNITVDAAFLWETNKKTYIFNRDEFWRINETTNMLDEGYPKNINRWKGIPSNITGVINWTDGFTYFFKKIFFWKIDKMLIEPHKYYPLPTPQIWFGCPETEEIHSKFSINEFHQQHLSKFINSQ